MNSASDFELVSLKDGVKSLRLKENHEIFHPGIGPRAEASILHVEQQRLVERCAVVNRFVIWDVGLGAAANTIVAIEALQNSTCMIEIHSFDNTTGALDFALANQEALHYIQPHAEALRKLLSQKSVKIFPHIEWHFHPGDFREQMMRVDIPRPQAVFYDPYSPSKNMDMWNLEHFTRLHRRLENETPYLLTNYTRSTVVRVTWFLAGFFVGIGTSIGDKRETSVASNSLKLLERPLQKTWLKRVSMSHSSAPLVGQEYKIAPISAEDFSLLEAHSQFIDPNIF